MSLCWRPQPGSPHVALSATLLNIYELMVGQKKTGASTAHTVTSMHCRHCQPANTLHRCYTCANVGRLVSTYDMASLTTIPHPHHHPSPPSLTLTTIHHHHPSPSPPSITTMTPLTTIPHHHVKSMCHCQDLD